MKTIQDIWNMIPSFDPSWFLSQNWHGEAVDILRVEAMPAQFKIWIVCHDGWIDLKTARLWAAWCVREAIKRTEGVDPRAIRACEVAELFAIGRADSGDLSVAWADARSAVNVSQGARSMIYIAAVNAVHFVDNYHEKARKASLYSAWSCENSADIDLAWIAQAQKLTEMLVDAEQNQ